MYFYVVLCIVCFCDVPCIVCVYMCTVLLPPGGYPIAVKYMIYIISNHIIYHIIPYHTISHIKTCTVHTTFIRTNAPVPSTAYKHSVWTKRAQSLCWVHLLTIKIAQMWQTHFTKTMALVIRTPYKFTKKMFTLYHKLWNWNNHEREIHVLYQIQKLDARVTSF